MNRRVVVTGLGVFSPLGIDVDTNWQGLLSGTSGISPITRFDIGDHPVQAAGQVPDFKPRDHIPKEHRKALKVMSWDVRLGVAAAMAAIEHAGIITEEKRVDPTRLGVSFGSGFMASDIDEMAPAFVECTKPGQEFDLKLFGVEAMRSFFPLWLLKYLPNMPACHISIFVDAEGPSNSITTGDASSAQAIGEGCRVIERGAADVMICGGVDGKVNPTSLSRYQLLGLACTVQDDPKKLSRPFEKSRSGFVPAEGGAAIVLESYDHAKARGAEIYAEITGYGSGCDAYRAEKVHPDGRGMQTALRSALRDAKLNGGEVDAVFANANGSVEGDRAESRALKAVFTDGGPVVTSTKSMWGYISAAQAVLDVVAACGALSKAAVPPTLNYDVPDPECPVNVVTGAAREMELNHVVVNSGGFGGQFAALLVSKFKG